MRQKYPNQMVTILVIFNCTVLNNTKLPIVMKKNIVRDTMSIQIVSHRLSGATYYILNSYRTIFHQTNNHGILLILRIHFIRFFVLTKEEFSSTYRSDRRSVCPPLIATVVTMVWWEILINGSETVGQPLKLLDALKAQLLILIIALKLYYSAFTHQ